MHACMHAYVYTRTHTHTHTRTRTLTHIDVSKEGALAPGAELAQVQKRVKEVLMELDARVRYEFSNVFYTLTFI